MYLNYSMIIDNTNPYIHSVYTVFQQFFRYIFLTLFQVYMSVNIY